MVCVGRAFTKCSGKKVSLQSDPEGHCKLVHRCVQVSDWQRLRGTPRILLFPGDSEKQKSGGKKQDCMRFSVQITRKPTSYRSNNFSVME